MDSVQRSKGIYYYFFSYVVQNWSTFLVPTAEVSKLLLPQPAVHEQFHSTSALLTDSHELEKKKECTLSCNQKKPSKNSACLQKAHCPEVPQLQFSTSYTAHYHPSFLLNWHKLYLFPAELTLQFLATNLLLCSHYTLMPPCLLPTDLRCCYRLKLLPSLTSFLVPVVPTRCLSNHIHFICSLRASTLTPACLIGGTEVGGNLWFHVSS